MKPRQTAILAELRMALIRADPRAAMSAIERFEKSMARHGIATEDREAIELQITQLRALAEAAQQGAQRAVDQINTILQSARNFQSYDESGQLHSADIRAEDVRRF